MAVIRGTGHDSECPTVFGDVSNVIETVRTSASRPVNAAMTVTYLLVALRLRNYLKIIAYKCLERFMR